MMQAILGQLLAMLSHHNKVLIFCFDLHAQTTPTPTKNITDFLRRLSRRVIGTMN
jgi:hypothetical protein